MDPETMQMIQELAPLLGLFKQNPGFLEQIKQHFMASQLLGDRAPFTGAAMQGTQIKAGMDSINKILAANPSDVNAYPDFWQNPMKYLPSLMQQQQQYGNSFDQARQDYVNRHGGLQKLMEAGLVNAPAHGQFKDSPGAADYQNWLKNYQTGEEYLPAYLRKGANQGRPTYMLDRELAWHKDNPAWDSGTYQKTPSMISTDEIDKVSKDNRVQGLAGKNADNAMFWENQ